LPRPLELRLPARPEALGEARHGVREWLRTLPMAPAAREDVVLACGEALANAVEHGGAGGRAGTTMWIDAAWEEDGVVSLTVRDDGRWAPPEPDPDGRRGRGIALMRRIMDAVEIDPADDHTKVSMSLRPEAPSTVVIGSATAPAVAPAPFAAASAEVVALDGLRMVRLLGEVDASSVPSLRAGIAPLLDAEGPLTIDVAGVSYIDSAGMRLLWEVSAALERRGERLGLIAPPGSRVRRALEMSGPDVAGLPDGSLIGDAM
jgi:anti-anti-sigma factor